MNFRPKTFGDRSRRAFICGCLFTLTAAAVGAQTSDAFESRVLAPSPFCEASAVLAAPWDGDLVLVADNERHEQLYVFKIDDGVLVPDEIWQMPAKHRPQDIEALARLDDEVVVVGSQSRKKSCKRDEDRQRLRRLASRQDGTLEETEIGYIDAEATWKEALEKADRCLATLFTSPSPDGAEAVCKAFVDAEKNASENNCHVVNIEGAFGTRDGRLWLGLRAPLAGGRAILLRLVDRFDELRFDRVALLDLEERGIRELALANDVLYGLAGPPIDVDVPVPFALFRTVVLGALEGGEPSVEILRRDLLTDSEGLLIREGRAYVLVDGDEGTEAGQCRDPAGWYIVELP